MENKKTTVSITPFLLGPIENKTFLVADLISHEAAVIDPSFGIQPVIDHIQHAELLLKYILITHAHFDHIAGVNLLLTVLPIKPHLALHRADLELWKDRGEALQCGFQLDQLPNPDHFVTDGEVLSIGSLKVVVHHTPGHSPGHVIYSLPQTDAIFVGDLIFSGSIGRTDLTGGNLDTLLSSIRKFILTCPDETRLLPGHGPETSVGIERRNNPFLN
jgi:glyoxylase-like metal-dependent hydrolase (beta-lactamase superfamily II)